MSDVVVLGPTGSIGSHLLRLLHADGVGVRTGNRRDFDYFTPSTYDFLFNGATHLFLLTPVVDTMVELTFELLAAARRAGIERVVKISAMGAALDSPTRLFRWHAESEKLVTESEIPWVNVRPNALMQNFIQHYAAGIRATSEIVVPAGGAALSFIDAQDVARAVYQALFDERLTGATLELTGSRALSFSEVASEFTSVLGRAIRYVTTSDDQARQFMILRKIPSWKIEALLELYASYRRGEASRLTNTVESVTDQPAEIFRNFISHHTKEFQ